jgi:hypothetical protein
MYRTSLRTALAAGLVLAAAFGVRADPLPEHAVAVVDYDIEVRLDPEEKTLTGRERIVWRNPSSDPVQELWFHLYLNAFRNSESTFFRESGGQLRDDEMTEDGWGWTEVTGLRRGDGRDLLPALSFEHPDDDNAEDRTVARVGLPEPVPPGGSIELEVTFEAKLPRIFARTGYVRDYFLVGQWFPKLGVYEPAGMRGRPVGGWNCHQFHAHSEFYADFGHYRVAITLPERFAVGATGRRTAKTANAEGTVTHVYEQGDVHDFAWTADPEFLEIRSTFSAETDVTAQDYATAGRLLGRSPAEMKLSDVEVIVLLQPGHAAQAERHLAAAKAAIRWFGLHYGRYPHATLTVVDPAPGGGGSGGMEYPTFITAGTSYLFNRWPLDRVLLPEEVTVHEFGHQYWQGMVASNEFEEAWLDEGLNSYSTGKAMEREYGPWAAQVPGVRVGLMEATRGTVRPERFFDPLRVRAWDYATSGSYGFSSYARTELALRTLENLLGEETMARLMRTFHERWRFRHPTGRDFDAVASEVAGRDLSGFFHQVFELPGHLDYEVASLSSRRVAEPRGRLLRDGELVTVTEEDAAKREDELDEKDEGRSWKSEVLVRRRGEIALPVEIELTFEDGPAERISWDGATRWKRIEVVRPKRLLSACVDPDDHLVLDVNRLNNARRLEGDSRVASSWGLRFLGVVQQALQLVGF